jgi:hypothetical protein
MAKGKKSSQSEIERQERRVKVLELRRSGESLRTIATLQAVSPQTVANDLNHALDELKAHIVDGADRLRALELARLDELTRAYWSQAVDSHDLKAANLLVRISERRARLLGLDVQPVRPDLDQSGPVVYQVVRDREPLIIDSTAREVEQPDEPVTTDNQKD